MQFYTTTSVYPIPGEHITLACWNTRKTIKFYIVCATCQNACACLRFFCLQVDFEMQDLNRYQVLLLRAGSLPWVSGRKWSCSESSHTRLPPCLRGSSAARSLQWGQDTAAHLTHQHAFKNKPHQAEQGPIPVTAEPCGSFWNSHPGLWVADPGWSPWICFFNDGLGLRFL